MTDIIERLRACVHHDVRVRSSTSAEAADEIERLRAKLDKIAKHPDTPELIRQYATGMLEPKP